MPCRVCHYFQRIVMGATASVLFVVASACSQGFLNGPFSSTPATKAGEPTLTVTGVSSGNETDLGINVNFTDLSVSNPDDIGVQYKIASLPSLGSLTLNGTPLAVGSVVSAGVWQSAAILYAPTGIQVDDAPGSVVNDAFELSYQFDGYAAHTTTLKIEIHNPCFGHETATAYNSVGDGSSAHPYVLCTPAQMNDLGLQTAAPLAAHYVVRADIDMSAIGTTHIIGPTAGAGTQFEGELDGHGHTVSNWIYNNPARSDVGLFGVIYDGWVHDLRLKDFNANGSTYVGSLAGRMLNNAHISNIDIDNATVNAFGAAGGAVGAVAGASDTFVSIDSVRAFAKVTAGAPGSAIGGLLGQLETGTVKNLQSAGDVQGVLLAGGLIGYVSQAHVVDSCSHASVLSTSDTAGGLVGQLLSSTISFGCATGSVSSPGFTVGGLVGLHINSDSSDSWASGNVSGAGYVGGYAGEFTAGHLTRSYATGKVTGSGSAVGGLLGLFQGSALSSIVDQSYATGEVAGSDEVGGLVGSAYGDGFTVVLQNSYATGHVDAAGLAAGFVGMADGLLTLRDFSTGLVTGGNPQGFVGANTGAGITVSDSYYDQPASGGLGSAGGGTAKTHAEMTEAATFSNFSLGTGAGALWSFPANNTDDVGYLRLNALNRCHGAAYSAGAPVGTGTWEDPYVVCNEIQMNNIPVSSGTQYIRLDAGIDMLAILSWKGLRGRTGDSAFAGVFDGNKRNGFYVSDISITGSSSDAAIGFISNLGRRGFTAETSGMWATVFDLRLNVSDISSSPGFAAAAGSVAGHAVNAWIVGVEAGASDLQADTVGGIVGLAEQTVLYRNLYSQAYLSGDLFNGVNGMGGIVGLARNSHLEQVYALGEMSGDGPTGGVVGVADNSTMTDVASRDLFDSIGVAGGIVGYMQNGSSIVRALNLSTISTSSLEGGLFGDRSNLQNTYTHSYMLDDTIVGSSAVSPSVGLAETLDGSASTQAASYATWDFTRVWTTKNDQFTPVFQWMP